MKISLNDNIRYVKQLLKQKRITQKQLYYLEDYNANKNKYDKEDKQTDINIKKRLNSKISLTEYRKLNKIPTNKELKQIVLNYIEYKNWYKNSLNTIKEKFPYNHDLFLKLLCVTSQQNNLKQNLEFTLMSYQSVINNNSPYEFNYGIADKVIKNNIKLVLNGELPNGQKIKSFTLALKGDLSQIVIDSHMTKFFTNNSKKTPCKTDIKHIQTIIKHLSKELNLQNSEIQACIWSYIKDKMEYSKDRNLYDYSVLLKDIQGEKFQNSKFICNDTINLLNIDVKTFNEIGV